MTANTGRVIVKILFIEPPKDFWFVMGEYLPPPYGILQLAAYLEREAPEAEIEVLDCNAEQLGWKQLEEKISSLEDQLRIKEDPEEIQKYIR